MSAVKITPKICVNTFLHVRLIRQVGGTNTIVGRMNINPIIFS